MGGIIYSGSWISFAEGEQRTELESANGFFSTIFVSVTDSVVHRAVSMSSESCPNWTTSFYANLHHPNRFLPAKRNSHWLSHLRAILYISYLLCLTLRKRVPEIIDLNSPHKPANGAAAGTKKVSSAKPIAKKQRPKQSKPAPKQKSQRPKPRGAKERNEQNKTVKKKTKQQMKDQKKAQTRGRGKKSGGTSGASKPSWNQVYSKVYRALKKEGKPMEEARCVCVCA